MRRPSTRIRRRPRRAGQGLFEACDETGFGPTFGIFDLDKSHCFGNSVRTPEDYSRSATWKMGLDPSEVPPPPAPPPCGAMRSPPVWIRSPRLGRWRLLESVSQSSPLATGALGGRRSRCPCRATPSVDPGGYTGAVNPRRHRVAVDPGGYGGAASARTRGRAHRRAHPRAAAQFAFPVPRVWGIPAGFLSFRDIGDSF